MVAGDVPAPGLTCASPVGVGKEHVQHLVGEHAADLRAGQAGEPGWVVEEVVAVGGCGGAPTRVEHLSHGKAHQGAGQEGLREREAYACPQHALSHPFAKVFWAHRWIRCPC